MVNFGQQMTPTHPCDGRDDSLLDLSLSILNRLQPCKTTTFIDYSEGRLWLGL